MRSEVVSLGTNCSGRTLSVLLNSACGPFVYLYDFCALSPDQNEEVGPFQSIRLSATDSARGNELQWNPSNESVFAVVNSDGTSSTYAVEFIVTVFFLVVHRKPKKFDILGTSRLKVPGTCLSWSPKGKQLVVGDAHGSIHQFKPEMLLVRSIGPPSSIDAKGNVLERCVGICWLSSTEFLIAYAPLSGESLTVSLLRTRKEGPPCWTHFDDIIYCSEQCASPQRAFFVFLLQWNLVLCGSLRSSEVNVLGKREGVWKVWSLNDNSRIELPLKSTQDENFPCGICVETSSETLVRMGEYQELVNIL
ncbi:unnamed protein product [Enterobius vermicularis]|uniref:ANAPC4_WD40 domain-containing protein n=1 Tax=Enterobius vermicularis TaxID=51028 RepID=A0A0N4V9X8_ENTVE|nr:unnamed protein product [Enterobius vermicularis]